MLPPLSLNGTYWRCTEAKISTYGLIVTVVDGIVLPELDGQDDIKIQYQNGHKETVKLNAFQKRFKQIKRPDPENIAAFTRKTKQHGGER